MTEKTKLQPLGSTAGLATDLNCDDPMAPRALHDNGPWTANKDGRRINSDDFTHDVSLIVTGDFYDDAQRKAYADNLAAKLNAGLTVANDSGKPTTEAAKPL